MAEKKIETLPAIVRVRFLGNHWTYENQKEYDLAVDEAARYISMGIAREIKE